MTKYTMTYISVSDVTCSQPVPLPNSAPEIPLKTSYKVGESVPYKCSTSHEHTLTKCLADGTWSGRGFVCASKMSLTPLFLYFVYILHIIGSELL